MRALAGVAVAAVLVLAATPVEAKPDHPFPKTEKAVRALARDVLSDVDASSAKMLREAHKLVREAKRDANEAIGGLPPLPGVPEAPDTRVGAIEVRASLVQPAVRDVDMTIGAIWIGASEGYWTGAYWIESDGAGSVLPAIVDVDEMGVIMFVDAGAAPTSEVHVTYHFLGLDGRYVTHSMEPAPVLDAMPVLQRADVGGAHASARGEEPEILLASPWNLFDRNVTMGLTLHAEGGATLYDSTLPACADLSLPHTEPGCRFLYVLAFPEEATRLDVWHVDERGERVVDRSLSRAEMLAGHTFGR